MTVISSPASNKNATDNDGANKVTPFDWRKHLPVHPAADEYPLMRDVDPVADLKVPAKLRRAS
jgi:hypothetical protein